MKKGDIFESFGRVYKFDSFVYDSNDKAHNIVAECLTPDEGEGTWWNIELVLDDLPVAVTIH